MSFADTPRLLNVNEVAGHLGISASALNKMRMTGDGPPHIKIGSRVAYDPADLTAWLEAQKRRSTQDTGAPAGGWPSFPDEPLRGALVAAEGEAFARSYLDPASWEAKTRTITARTETARRALTKFSLRQVFTDLGATIAPQVVGGL